MISGLTILAGRLYVNLFGLFNIIPFEFDTKKRGLKISSSILKKGGFRAAICLNIFVLVIFVYVNAKRAVTGDETYKPKHIFLGALCIILLATSLLLNLNILTRMEEIPAIMIYALMLDKKLEKVFKGQPRPKLVKIFGIDIVSWFLFFLPLVFLASMIFGSLIGVTLGMRDKDSGLRRWIQSVFQEKADHPLTTFLIFWAVFGMAGIAVAPLTLYLLMGIQYIYMNNYWAKVMVNCPNKSLCLTEGFIPLKVVNILINQHVIYMMPWLLFIAVSLLSISLYGSLKLYHVFGMPSYLLFPVLGIIITVIDIVLLPHAAKMDLLSEHFLLSCSVDQSDWVRKMARAFKPIRMNIGSYGYIDESYTLTVFSMVIDNTINLLLTF